MQGDLEPGTSLPPQRELAARLGVNPNTVAAAYRTLRDRGVIETDGRRGSRVRHRPATSRREPLGELPPGTVDLTHGSPDPALLPPLSDALAAAARRASERPTLYGDAAVDPDVAALFRRRFDADAVPDGPIVLTAGALDGIERVLAAHLRPGDAVALEDPGWSGLLDLVPALGMRTLPVGVDDHGPDPAALRAALDRGARAVVITSRAQNPTGAALSADRAQRLRDVLAAAGNTLLVEDDHGRGTVDLPLHSLAGVTERWALVSSVAKAYGPDLRLAALTGDMVTTERVAGRQRLGPGWVSTLLQRAVLFLHESGAVDTAAVAASYAERRDGLRTRLAERGVPAHGRSGMNLWVPVSDETAVVARLLRAGWAVAPGSWFRIASGAAVRITVSPLRLGDLDPLADAVASAVRPATPRHYA